MHGGFNAGRIGACGHYSRLSCSGSILRQVHGEGLQRRIKSAHADYPAHGEDSLQPVRN